MKTFLTLVAAGPVVIVLLVLVAVVGAAGGAPPPTPASVAVAPAPGSVDGIAPVVLEAYVRASAGAARWGGCRVPWWVLAGIGRVESRHAGGRSIDPAGRVTPAIVGSPTPYGRAQGPMQFLPGTWRALGIDGDGDGVADPQDLGDAAASAVHHLCRPPADLAIDRQALRRAVWNYNHSWDYVTTVLGWADAYARGGET